MLRIIIACAAAVIPAYTGICASERVKRRERELCLILQDIILITNCVKYTKEPPCEIFKKCASGIIKNAAQFDGTGVNTGNFHPAWEKAVSSDKVLSEKDKQVLRALGASLGGSDTEGQAGVLESARAALTAQCEEARAAAAEKSKLYRKLGILCGIAAAALII